MDYKSIIHSTVTQLAAALESKQVSSVEICKAFLKNASEIDSQVSAFNSIDETFILEKAKASDARRSNNEELSRFDGIPLGFKDVIAVNGQPLTCSSKMLEGFTAPYDSTVTNRLLMGGWIPFGRLNMDEYAMGSSTENSGFKATLNPWDLERIPGGSSGGSAAAVAARMCPVSLGSDTGGSIRQPAAFCGVVGLKPTYGRVSRFGLVAFASSLDQIGPMGSSVEDVAAVLDAISSPDPLDSTSYQRDLKPVLPTLKSSEFPRKVGLPKEYFGEGIDPSVRKAVDSATEKFRENGSEIVEISLPHTKYAVSTYYIVAMAEASSNLARYDGVRYGHRSKKSTDAVNLHFYSRGEGFGEEVKRRIILGTYVLSSGYYDAYYKKAQKVRTLIRQDFLNAFEEVDTILTPTTPTPAFKLGEKQSDPIAMYLADIFTLSVNLAGLPALSLPAGLGDQSLPIGVQLIGKPFEEGELLQHATSLESAIGFSEVPPILKK